MTTRRMKELLVLPLFILLLQTTNATAQQVKPAPAGEDYGNTLNLGLGPGYYGYLGQSVPFLFANYEFDVARSFTLAPFIGFASYRSTPYYYQNNDYYYRETVVPIGVKGTYYFDDLLGLNPRWDVYLAASLGFTFVNVTWDNGYTGDRGVARDASPLYLDLHIGAEYHVTHKVGIFLDLSTGVSTVGVAIHRR